MAIKPNGQDWKVKEQIVEDLVSGLTFQFVTDHESSAPYKMIICGDVPFGNREIIFDKGGAEAGGGTYPGGICRPSWLVEVKKPVG